MMKKFESSIEDRSPRELVELLDSCGGDLQEFANAISPGVDVVLITMRAEFVLADSQKDYVKWNQLIQARNQARFKLAQQKAFEAIGKYEIPTDDQGKNQAALTTMVSYMRFWLGAHTVGEQTRARKEAANTTGGAEARALDELFEGLTEGG